MATPEIVECRPPRDLVRGKVALIGDAAHTMRPTFGQGAALAMEDAITLANGGAAGLAQRWLQMMTLYTASKAGSYSRLRATVCWKRLGTSLFGSCLTGCRAHGRSGQSLATASRQRLTLHQNPIAVPVVSRLQRFENDQFLSRFKEPSKPLRPAAVG